MADIFISYSSEDKTSVKLIAEILERKGGTVWWDRKIPVGRRFDTVIEEEIAKAYCVIVIWTKRSVNSEWVKNEANEAAQLGMLAPILLEDVKIPLAFRRIEAARLIGWEGDISHPEMDILFSAVAAIIQQRKQAYANDSEADKTINQIQQTGSGTDKERNRKVRFSIIRKYGGIAATGLIASLLTTYCYLRFIQGKVTDEIDQRNFYLILILFGISISALVYGILNGYASLKIKKPGTKFKLIGPAVGAMLILFGGVYLPHGLKEKIVTIRVFDEKNPITQGEVKLYLQAYTRNQTIDNNGRAQFPDIPGNSMSGNIKIEVLSPGYTTYSIDTVLQYANPLEITLSQIRVIYISGRITNAAEMPIKDVEINVDGTKFVAFSITDGTYKLKLEEYGVGEEIKLITSHKDFEDKTIFRKIDKPEMNNVDFVLNPVIH